MDIKEILSLAENLFEQAALANAYWQVMRQYEGNVKEFNKEVNCSPAFYQITYSALYNAMFVTLSKLYDNHSSSLTIKTLLTDFCDIKIDELPPKERWQREKGVYDRAIKPSDEVFFKKEVEKQKKICAMLDGEYIAPVISLSLEEYKELYRNKFNGLKPQIKTLRNRRNMMHVHNDKNTNFDYGTLVKNYPINADEIEDLLDFALDLSGFCIAIISSVSKNPELMNIDDWRITLTRVRYGLTVE